MALRAPLFLMAAALGAALAGSGCITLRPTAPELEVQRLVEARGEFELSPQQVDMLRALLRDHRRARSILTTHLRQESQRLEALTAVRAPEGASLFITQVSLVHQLRVELRVMGGVLRDQTRAVLTDAQRRRWIEARFERPGISLRRP
jgi:hypothetical protein